MLGVGFIALLLLLSTVIARASMASLSDEAFDAMERTLAARCQPTTR